jgi:MFS family permease
MGFNVLGKDGFYGWVNLGVMFFFNMTIMLLMMGFGVFLPIWHDYFGWSRGMISGAQTLSLILSGVAAPLVGMFLMKHGARKAIILGNALTVAGLFIVSFQTRIWELYIFYGVIIGVGMSIGGMLATMTVTNNWFIIKRPAALSLSMASMGVAGIAIIPLLVKLIEIVGWRNSYRIIAGVVFLFCFAIPGLLIRNRPEDLGQVPDGPKTNKAENPQAGNNPYKHLYKTPVDFTAKEAMRTRALWLLVAYGTLQFLVINGLSTHQLAYLSDIGIPTIKAAFAVGLFSAMMMISQLGIGFLGLRIKMHTLAVAAMILGIIGITFLLFARSLPMVLIYSAIMGTGFGIQSISMGNLFPDYFGRSEFPKIMGYTMPFNIILSSFGAPITGFIRDATGSYIPAFQLCFVLLLISFFCILFAKPPVHPSLRRSQESGVRIQEQTPVLSETLVNK